MTLCSQPEVEHRIRGIVLSLSIRYGRAVAERFLAEFERAMRRIQRFPLSGSRLPECRDSELRQSSSGSSTACSTLSRRPAAQSGF